MAASENSWWIWPGRRAGALLALALFVCLLLWMASATAQAFAIAGFAIAALAAIWPVFVSVLAPLRASVSRAAVPSEDTLLRGWSVACRCPLC